MMASSGDNSGQTDIGHAANDRDDDSMDEARSWRILLERSENRSRSIRGSNYVQLATVDQGGRPRCRSIVFRGFLNVPDDHVLRNTCDNRSCIMKMTTDSRSRKVEQVMAHPTQATELVWWFPRSSEQYRVSGQLVFVGSGQYDHDSDQTLATARREQWGNLSEAARESFLVDKVPGQAYDGEPSPVPVGGRDPDGKVVPPPDAFLLMLLLPERVDYLRLTNMYRQVDTRLESSDWTSVRVNP